MYNIDEQQRMNEEGQHSVFLISTLPNMYGYILSIDFSICFLHDSKSNNTINRHMRNSIFELTLI